MPLTDHEKRYLEGALDKCDAALVGKPFLESVYDREWRRELRTRLLAVENMHQVGYPSAYAVPHFDMFYPADYQQRLEEGAQALLPTLSSSERNHIIERLRGTNPASAEEELLLARGFAAEFGEGSIVRPMLPTNAPRPEFALRTDGRDIFVEAKGLFDSDTVRVLNEAAIKFGHGGWTSFDPKINDPGRFRNAAREKMLKSNPNYPCVLVLTQYSGFPSADLVIHALREAALSPSALGVPDDRQPLVLAYTAQRFIQGVWINSDVATRRSLPPSQCDRIASAIARSFYPRRDGRLFTEKMTDKEHVAALRALHGIPPIEHEA